MGEIMDINRSDAVDVSRKETDLLEFAEGILLDARTDLIRKDALSVPISELATLGAAVSSLIPALRSVTTTTTVSGEGFYTLANKAVGDTLKYSKKQDIFWGSFKTAEKTSKMAKFKEVSSLQASSSTTMPLDPATMMMAVALHSIEMELKNIAETGKQILTFLEVEKESEIEADIETLINIISNYKLNWDNEHFVAGNHKMVLDIQRTARKNMNSFQKKVVETLRSKQLIENQTRLSSSLKSLTKNFKYYRLSLYSYSLASLLEIMLSGNFKETYISGIKDEIRNLSEKYRDLFGQCSAYLEKMSNSTIETNALKWIGSASKTVGNLIGNIPVVKEGKLDEFLQDSGAKLHNNATEAAMESVKEFAMLNNPGTSVFSEKMSDMIRIYNHTSQISFDENRIYLVAN